MVGILDLVHMDLTGKALQTIDDERFVLAIINVHSRYDWIRLCKAKSEAFLILAVGGNLLSWKLDESLK